MNENIQEATNEDTQEKVIKPQIKENIVKPRLISMLVLTISIVVALPVLVALIIGQTLFGLFAAETNEAIKNLAKQITDYIYDALNYLSFNSDNRPFPYQGWNVQEDKATSISEESQQTA